MRHTEMSELRYIGASAIAAMIPSCMVLALALFALATESWWGTGTEVDDAPMRVVGIGIVSSLPMIDSNFEGDWNDICEFCGKSQDEHNYLVG